MLKLLSLLLLLAPTAVPSTPEHTHGVPAGYQQVTLNGQTFTIPEDLEIELVAGPPLVDRPVHADFDEQGRLYLADSSGSNDRPAEQLKDPTHRLIRLVDTDGDGKFDQSTVFAEKVPFPEGAMWYEGSFYVAAPPSIWKFTDKDGDGVAEERTEWFQGKTLTGCANDLHGPYRGPDGWIYWCKGAFAEQTYERPGQAPFVTRASHIFRCRPDGTGIEHVMTGGMDNPVEVAFTNGGERIFTTTFFMHPAGGQRDGMIHAIYGGVYGKIHDVINGHPRTGEIMPVLTHFGPAAPAGLTCSQSANLGEEFQGALYSAQFSLHKIGRHRLVKEGARFKTEDSDLLVSDSLDFHPTDVLEDADGSMIVVDTGPWYKLCCPSSQLAKPDILGAIYRVRRKKTAKIADPRGLKLKLSEESQLQLAKHLSDPRHVVAEHAGWELSKRGESAVPALENLLQGEPSSVARRRAVWALCRIEGSAARQAIRRALIDVDEDVRQVAIHSVSLHRDATSIADLEQILLRVNSAHNKRAAAEALGRLKTPSVVPTLLKAAADVKDDRILEHSITYALIELDLPDLTRTGLASSSSGTIRSALIALDQMPGGGITPDPITPYLVGDDPILKTTALWLVDRHPEWGTDLAAFLRQRLFAKGTSPAQQSELIQLFPQLAKAPEIQQLIADGIDSQELGAPQRLELIKILSQTGIQPIPAVWAGPLAQSVASNDLELASAAVTASRSFVSDKPLPSELQSALLNRSSDANTSTPTRIEALSAAATGLPGLEVGTFNLLMENLGSEIPVPVRLSVADILSRVPLQADQLQNLADAISTASPIEIERLATTFKQSKDASVGKRLVAALESASALAALRKEFLEELFKPYGPEIRQLADPVFAKIDESTRQQRERLELLLTNLSEGDVRRGHAVFNSTKAACFSCHSIGYRGGKVGPDLTRIGQIRNQRDLLESIVFPSASFVRSYEPVAVATTEGKIFSGILKTNSPQEIILKINALEEIRIPRDRIEEVSPGTVSVMPAGLEQQLSLQDLADLIAFLLASR